MILYRHAFLFTFLFLSLFFFSFPSNLFQTFESMLGHTYRQQEPYWYNSDQERYLTHDAYDYTSPHLHRKRSTTKRNRPRKYRTMYEKDEFLNYSHVPAYTHHYEHSQPPRRPDQTSRADHTHYMMQPTGQPWPPHPNQPMITFDPMMHFYHSHQILDTRATDLLYANGNPSYLPSVFHDQVQRQFPLPMMQPYFMPNGFPPNLASNYPDPYVVPSLDKQENEEQKEEIQEVPALPQPKSAEQSMPTSPIESQQPLRRRLSLVESVLESLSLLSNVTYPKANSQSIVTSDSSSSPSQDVDHSELATNESSLSQPVPSMDDVKESRRPSLSRKLSKKASILQSRQFIWCYRLRDADGALWTAFDVKNQSTLDKQYALLVSKKQQQKQQEQQDSTTSLNEINNDDIVLFDKGVVINKQSQVSGQLMVLLSTGTAWCYNTPSSSFGSDHAIIYDVASLPSQLNRLVVSEEKQPNLSLRRSKSFDGFASKLFGAVLKK
ncbi:hypothetical protein BD560DRAFT_395524 [Blakeslea trispora]|nr:hypothetical protein BD560DRAFT_395524 [Blakeslea trispora]